MPKQMRFFSHAFFQRHDPRDDDARHLIRRILHAKLSYLPERRLMKIARVCRVAEEARLPGIFLEAGCALGGSAILLASLKDTGRPLVVYDVFGMIPPPSEHDGPDVHERYAVIARRESEGISGDEYYGYQHDLEAVVRSNFAEFGIDCDRQNVSLVKGMIQETMTLAEPVALAHIDVDWYEGVAVCLQRIFPRLVVGGTMILDDYHAWSGCRTAADEFLAVAGPYVATDDSDGSLKIRRIEPGMPT